MYSLLIDTHGKNVLIILYKDGKIFCLENLETQNKHSQVAMPLLDKVLKNSEVDIKNINEIFVVNGPGSFTGVRIAVTIAKTIAYCLNIPIKTIDALTILAVNVEADKKIVSIEDRNGAFVGEFDKDCLPVKDYQYLNKSVYLEYKNNNDVINECDIDYEKVYDYLSNINYINVHEVKPIYIKGISALNDK